MVINQNESASTEYNQLEIRAAQFNSIFDLDIVNWPFRRR